MTTTTPVPSITVAVGTYEGVLAGWQYDSDAFKISFATPVHGGSIRGLTLAANGLLLSCGYDEYLQTHDFRRQLTSSGQIRTPSDMGTPVCASFGPPYSVNHHMNTTNASSTAASSSHCIVGFSSGQLVIYKKRDWSVQHVLQGHQGGTGALGVHPSGKLALTGGVSDGKLKCWDLTKGRLAYASKINPKPSQISGRVAYESVISIVWNSQGTAYGFAYGSHVTVRDVATGKDLLDVDLPCRVNQICLLEVKEGMFLAAAANDGSLPILAVSAGVDEDASVRRAMMAIEPVSGVVAGEERYRCIHEVQVGTPYVVTANSGGVVSLMNLQGAINMLTRDDEDDDEQEENEPSPEDDDDGSTANKRLQNNESDAESSEGEDELAVDILDSIQLGSGSRITCMVVFCQQKPDENQQDEQIDDVPQDENVEESNITKEEVGSPSQGLKRKREVAMDPEAMDRARALVSQAKKIQKKKEKKRKKQKSAAR